MPSWGSTATAASLALTADVIGDVGAYSIYPWTAALEPVQVVSFLPGPYRIRPIAAACARVATSKAPTGPYRGVGRPISTFVMERLIDMAARQARHRPAPRSAAAISSATTNFRTGSRPASSGTSPASSECLEAACEAIDYDASARAAGAGPRPQAGSSASASRATRN